MRKLFPKILNSSPKSHKSQKLPKTVSTMTKDCQNLDFLEKESEGVDGGDHDHGFDQCHQLPRFDTFFL